MPTIAEILAGSMRPPPPPPKQPLNIDFSEADPDPADLQPQEPPPPGMNEFGQMTIPSFEMSQRVKDQMAVEAAASRYRLANQVAPPDDRGVAYDLTNAATGNPALAGLADLFAPRPPRTPLEAGLMVGGVGGPKAAARGVGKAVGEVADDAARFVGPPPGEAPASPLADVFTIDADPRERLQAFYTKAGEQMDLDPALRIQPDPTHQFIDTDYQTPMPNQGSLPDLSLRYPRNPDPLAELPKADRARVFVDRQEEVAQEIARRIRESGQMEMPTRYFYHVAGPIYRAAQRAGLSAQDAMKWIQDFGEYMGATSPRTTVVPNTKNALSVMAKEAAGVPHREILGPGTIDAKTGLPGISEQGFPMMTGPARPKIPAGSHGVNIDDIQSGRGLDVLSHPKPSTFGPGMAGNLSGVTVDTHAIRGAVQAYNRLYPGEVPPAYIYKKFREEYAKNPSKLTPDMIDDSLGTQDIMHGGQMVEAQTEYAPFADVYHRTAEILGVSPAEAQSMGWFGSGGDTNLGSAMETVVKVLNDRISVTAQALGKTPEEIATLLFQRKIPLMSILGTAGAGGAILNSGQLPGLGPQDQGGPGA